MTTAIAALTCARCHRPIPPPAADCVIADAVCAECGPFHCLSCKERTPTLNPELFTMANGKSGSRGVCAGCGRRKTRIGGLAAFAAA